MRYEVMRLLQFVFSLSLVFAAFLGGMFVGWRRWGRTGPVDHSRPDDGTRVPSERTETADATSPGRRDLFAPDLVGARAREVVDLRVGPSPARLGLPTASGAATAVGNTSAGAPTPDALA